MTLQPEFIQLHVLTKNLQSIRDQSRWEDLLAEFDVCDCDVAFFSETWRSERQQCFETSSGGRIFLSGGASRQGVGIGISARLWRLIKDVSFHAYSSRVCLLNFSICDLKFSMLSVYFPTSWDDDAEIEAMYEILQLILNDVRRSGARIVIGGDFNANVGSVQWSDEQDVVGQWGSGLRNARGATLITWILMNGLLIASRQSPTNNVDDSWTCQRAMDGVRVQLDYILTDARACVDSVWHDHLIPIGLDHRCVHCLLLWRGVRPLPRNRRLNLKNWMPILDMDGAPSLFQNSLREMLDGNSTISCEVLEHCLLECGKQHGVYGVTSLVAWG